MSDEIIGIFSEARRRAEDVREAVSRLTMAAPSARHKTANPSNISQIRESGVYKGLASLSEKLANSYEQVKLDIQDTDRISWAGTAHEIREVLATLLRLLAPEDKVTAEAWYRQEPKTSGPTQKQRVRYILQQHGAGSKEREVAEQAAQLEDMIGSLVRATYSRASDAAHTFKVRREVSRIIVYFDAFAHDLLNLE